MPPIHPDSLAPSDQSAAISCSAAAKVICAARFATKPNDSKAVALADPPRTRDGSSNARVSAMSHLIARGCMPSQVASGIAMCSPESDSVPEQQTDVVEGHVLSHYRHLLPAGVPGSPGACTQRNVLPECRRRGGRGVSSLPALPARDGAVLP